MSKKTIGVFVGSLRMGSFSRRIAQNVVKMLPADFSAEWIDIGGLELYNSDYDDDGTPPASYTKFREAVSILDAFLFVTPEYNRSIPAALKNALDVGSRPYGKSVWDGKPGAIISVAPGKLAAFGANHHLRQCMVFLNVYMMQQPEAYIGGAAELLAPNGSLASEDTKAFLQNYANAFVDWINHF